MKIIEPNIATPIRKPKTLATEKIELPKSRIGMIGSCARRSTSHEQRGEHEAADEQRRGRSPEVQPRSGPAQAV